MEYRVEHLLAKVNKYIGETKNEVDKNEDLKKLEDLKQALEKRKPETKVCFEGPDTMDNICKQYLYIKNEVNKYSISIDLFEQLLDKHISKLANEIKTGKEEIDYKTNQLFFKILKDRTDELFGGNMDKFDKINDQIDKAMLKPYAEEIDAEIKKYRKDSENYNECIELKALIKNSPKNKTVFIKNDEDFFSQLPSFFTQIGQGRDKYTRERTELVKSIKDQLTIPEIQKDDHNSNGQILHVEFNGKLDQDEIMQNKFSIKELGDIASVQIKNYDNDCREIDGKILTL